MPYLPKTIHAGMRTALCDPNRKPDAPYTAA